MAPQPDRDDDSAEAWQTATAAEAMTAAMVTLVSDAAETPATTQSAAGDRLVGGDEFAAIAMQLKLEAL